MQLYLTSTIHTVAEKISQKINGQGKKLAFIKTASEVEKGDLSWLQDDRAALTKAGFLVSNYTFTDKTQKEVRDDLADCDVIMIEGGNIFYLMQQIQKSDCVGIIKEYLDQGKIYIGCSAGSVVVGPDLYPYRIFDELKKAPDLKGFKGLGLVDFIIGVHWGSDSFKDGYLKNIEELYKDKNKVILLNDNQYIEVKDDWYKIVE